MMSDPNFFHDSDLELEVIEADKVSRKIRARGGNLMAVEVFFKAGAIGYEHRHVHEQVCYCLEGEFVFTIEGKTTTLKAGDSVYVPPSVLHGATCIAEGRLLDIFTPQREDFLKA
jgi:quercetin dioxygenase-like cupin family protein